MAKTSPQTVTIENLRDAFKEIRQSKNLVILVLKSFDEYAQGITDHAQKKNLDSEIPILVAAQSGLLKYDEACKHVDTALSKSAKLGRIMGDRKAIVDLIVDSQLNLFEAMHSVVRAVPEKHELHERAIGVLAYMSTQTFPRGVS